MVIGPRTLGQWTIFAVALRREMRVVVSTSPVVMVVSMSLARGWFTYMRMSQCADNSVQHLQGDGEKGEQNLAAANHGEPFTDNANCS